MWDDPNQAMDFLLSVSCKMKTGSIPALATNTAQLEDLKERKAIIIESETVIATMADFYTSIQVPPLPEVQGWH